MSKKTRNILVIVIVAVVAVGAVWYVSSKNTGPKFCFNFEHDMQFGDREVAHPYNIGFRSSNGMTFYIPEVPALQTALKNQGFYVDPYEATGGKVYVAAFYGPSTRSAVMAFQKKYGLPETGQVTNDVIDQLNKLYACPPSATSTSTGSVASTSSALPSNLRLSTTTPLK